MTARKSQVLFMLLLVAIAGPVVGQELDQVPNEVGKTIWFDPEVNSIVPVPLEDREADSEHRDSRWLPNASRIKQQPATSNNVSNGWFNTGITTANIVGWALILLLFVLIAAAVIYAFSKLEGNDLTSRERDENGNGKSSDEQLLERMKELPTELAQIGGNLRSEAERLMKLNAFDEAIKCLFGHQLLILDRRGFLRLSRGKTNGRYVVETKRSSPEAGSLLRHTTDVFEASYFGRHTPSKHDFELLWQENAALETLAE